MYKKWGLLLFFLSLSSVASENSFSEWLARSVQEVGFSRVLSGWQQFYSPIGVINNQYVINNRLTFLLAQKGLWSGTTTRVLDATAYYAYNAAPYLILGKKNEAWYNFKETLATDLIVSSAKIIVPGAQTILDTPISRSFPIPLDPLVRAAVQYKVVRPYLLPIKQTVSINQNIKEETAIGTVIEINWSNDELYERYCDRYYDQLNYPGDWEQKSFEDNQFSYQKACKFFGVQNDLVRQIS